MRSSFQQGVNIELAESFPVYVIDKDPRELNGLSLRAVVRHTGQWHHQIKHAGDANEFARSSQASASGSTPAAPDAAAGWQINAIFTSDIAKHLDETIDWIDRNHTQVAADGAVNLLIVPAIFMHAFWIESAPIEYVVIADVPSEYATLQRERFYAADELMALFTNLPTARHFPTP